MLSLGMSPWEMSIRQFMVFVESWWLDFFEPAQWNEVMSHLLSVNSASSQKSLFDADGKAVGVDRSLIDEMNALMATAASQSDELSRADG